MVSHNTDKKRRSPEPCKHTGQDLALFTTFIIITSFLAGLMVERGNLAYAVVAACTAIYCVVVLVIEYREERKS